jgi:hypothetical protein
VRQSAAIYAAEIQRAMQLYCCIAAFKAAYTSHARCNHATRD